MKHPEVYALLWLTRDSERRLADFLLASGLRRNAIQRGMHLTVYHAQRSLPGLRLGRRNVDIVADVAETRLMVMAPGGETARDDLDPRRQSIGPVSSPPLLEISGLESPVALTGEAHGNRGLEIDRLGRTAAPGTEATRA